MVILRFLDKWADVLKLALVGAIALAFVSFPFLAIAALIKYIVG